MTPTKQHHRRGHHRGLCANECECLCHEYLVSLSYYLHSIRARLPVLHPRDGRLASHSTTAAPQCAAPPFLPPPSAYRGKTPFADIKELPCISHLHTQHRVISADRSGCCLMSSVLPYAATTLLRRLPGDSCSTKIDSRNSSDGIDNQNRHRGLFHGTYISTFWVGIRPASPNGRWTDQNGGGRRDRNAKRCRKGNAIGEGNKRDTKVHAIWIRDFLSAKLKWIKENEKKNKINRPNIKNRKLKPFALQTGHYKKKTHGMRETMPK